MTELRAREGSRFTRSCTFGLEAPSSVRVGHERLPGTTLPLSVGLEDLDDFELPPPTHPLHCLYDQLKRSENYIRMPTKFEDLAQLQPGSLVELGGTIEKNAVDSVIDYIEAISILTQLDTTAGKGKGGQAKSLSQMRDALNKDRQRTPISNALLRCSSPAGLTAVLTLRTQNLRDLTLSELHKNSCRVIGKVTRSIAEGETMSAFENYGLGLVEPTTLQEAFDGIGTTGGIVTDLSEVAVSGPAVQVLPLMVFV